MSRVGRYIILSALAASLSACALVGGGSKPLDTFVLSAVDTGAGGTHRGRLQVLIAEPTAIKALDGVNIVIRPKDGEVQFLSGAQWADRLPRVIQAKLAETFQRTGRLGGVGKPGEGLAIDFQVATEIRAFEIRLDGGDRADVQLYVRVINDRNGVVRASRVFDASSPVSGTGNGAYVAALDRAFREAEADIATWAISAM